MHIQLLGPLQVRDAAGRPVHVGGRRLRVLLTLLALQAGRVVPAGWLTEQIWPDELPGNPGNALQTLVSRLRADLRRAGLDELIESHPAGYALAVPPDAVDVTAFEALAAGGRRALASGDPLAAARALRTALASWGGQPLADAAGCDAAEAAAARLTELRSAVLADRIEADLALGEGPSLVGELRALTSADPLAERPRALLMRALYAAGRQAEALSVYTEARELLADRLGVDPSAGLEQVYLRILRGEEGVTAAARAAEPFDESERAVPRMSRTRCSARSASGSPSSPGGLPSSVRTRWTGWPPRSRTATTCWCSTTASTSSRRWRSWRAGSSPPARGCGSWPPAGSRSASTARSSTRSPRCRFPRTPPGPRSPVSPVTRCGCCATGLPPSGRTSG